MSNWFSLAEQGLDGTVRAIETVGPRLYVGGDFARTNDPNAPYYAQFGTKRVGTGTVGISRQGISVAISRDGLTMAVGGPSDNTNIGAVWVYTWTAAGWVQQGSKLVGSGAIGAARQGSSVALSEDGNTLIFGGNLDDGSIGAAWVFTRTSGVWSQQAVLRPSDNIGSAEFGSSVALSDDGNTAAIGGPFDDGLIGAAWVFTRAASIWTQEAKFLTGALGILNGLSVALSGDGNTLLIASTDDLTVATGTVFTRAAVWTFQANLSVGVVTENVSVTLSQSGDTAALGLPDAEFFAVFVRSGVVWSQQGGAMSGTGGIGPTEQGRSIALSSDGNTLVIGGPQTQNLGGDNAGAFWVFTRSGTVWTQRAMLLQPNDPTATSLMGFSISISGDARTVIAGGPSDSALTGAAWVFAAPLNHLACYNTLTGIWSGVSGGTNAAVRALAFDSGNNSLYVGGDFATPGSGIAVWNGASWSTLGNGVGFVDMLPLQTPLPFVAALLLDSQSNLLHVGGFFDRVDGMATVGFASWDGSSWLTAAGLATSVLRPLPVSCLAIDPMANALFAGQSNISAPVSRSKIYTSADNGRNWTTISPLINGAVFGLAWDGSTLYAGGDFGSMDFNPGIEDVAKWDGGTTWSALDMGNDPNDIVRALHWNGSDLYAGGDFITPTGHIGRWDGTAWSSLGTGTNDNVYALNSDAANIWAGGEFTLAGGVADTVRIAGFGTGPICVHPSTCVQTTDGQTFRIDQLPEGASLIDYKGTETKVLEVIQSLPLTDNYISIARDALAPGVPLQELLIRAGHPILLDGQEVECQRLINGTTIRAVRTPELSSPVSLVTPHRTFIPMHGIPVCTWSAMGWKNFKQHDPRAPVTKPQ